MNAHFTLARRQVTTLQTDLLALEAAYAGGGSTASLNGQITAGLAALSRTSDDYESMAKREIVEAVKEKALRCVAPRGPSARLVEACKVHGSHVGS